MKPIFVIFGATATKTRSYVARHPTSAGVV